MGDNGERLVAEPAEATGRCVPGQRGWIMAMARKKSGLTIMDLRAAKAFGVSPGGTSVMKDAASRRMPRRAAMVKPRAKRLIFRQ